MNLSESGLSPIIRKHSMFIIAKQENCKVLRNLIKNNHIHDIIELLDYLQKEKMHDTFCWCIENACFIVNDYDFDKWFEAYEIYPCFSYAFEKSAL